MPHVRSVSVGVWVGAGSRRENTGENGICHFLEHMLFKGTHHRSAEDIARGVDSIGGNLDAFTAKELVSFNTKVLDEHLPIAFDILADLVLNPLFQPEDIQKEKGVILEELKMEEDNPEYLVHEIFSSNFWTGHPLGKSILGTKDSIARFDRSMVEDFWRRHYVPGNIAITAAGNLEHAQLVELVAKYFASLPTADAAAPESAPATHARLTIRNKRSLEQVHVCLGVPSYPLTHENRFTCYVLNVLLGGGMSSRLFQKIRERLGLAYAVFSELSLYRDTGCLVVYAGTSAKTLRRVVECTLEEFRALKGGRNSRRGVAARQGPSEGLVDAQPGIHFQPHGEPGPAGTLLRPVLRTGRDAGRHRARHRGRRGARGSGVVRLAPHRADRAGQPDRSEDRPGRTLVLENRDSQQFHLFRHRAPAGADRNCTGGNGEIADCPGFAVVHCGLLHAVSA